MQKQADFGDLPATFGDFLKAVNFQKDFAPENGRNLLSLLIYV